MQQLLGRADGISLRTVLPRAKFFGASDVRVHNATSDFRQVGPQSIFVAVVTADEDGHDYIEQAIERGAAAVVTEQLVPVSVPCCVVPDTRKAHGLLCQHLAGLPHQGLELIGITGTFGKTVTAMLMASVLRAAERQTGVTCSMGYSDSETTAEAGTTTPRSAELARWLARMSVAGCRNGVVEVSSEALATRQLAGVQFDAAVMTNLCQDHLDLHGSVMNYQRAKAQLVQTSQARRVRCRKC